MAEYKGSWPVEKLVEYINNGHLAQQQASMNELAGVTIESLIALKDRNRKVRKRSLKKDTAPSNPALKLEPSGERPSLEEAVEKEVDVSSSISTDSYMKQFCEIVNGSTMKNGEVLPSDSAFVTPRSSSSDFTDYQFFDDLPLSGPTEEEFQVVKRKKKNKNSILDGTSSAVSGDCRLSRLEACKEILENRVVGQNLGQFFLPNLESCSSFSISISTFESRSSSVRSASPLNSGSLDCIVGDSSIPGTADASASISTDRATSNGYYCTFISGVDVQNTLQVDTDSRTRGIDLTPSEQYVEAGTDVLCVNSEESLAPTGGHNLFLSNATYPDVVTSTIYEHPGGTSVEISRQNQNRKLKSSLPQPAVTDGNLLGLTCLTFEDDVAPEAPAAKPDPLSGVVFGDVGSSAFRSQDIRNCDMMMLARKAKSELFERQFLKTQSSEDDHGTCSKPVVFLDSLGDVFYDLGISFVFDCAEDGEVNAGLCYDTVHESGPAKVTHLPDLVNPSTFLLGAYDVSTSGLGHEANDICFQFCDDSKTSPSSRLDGAQTSSSSPVQILTSGAYDPNDQNFPCFRQQTSFHTDGKKPEKSSTLNKCGRHPVAWNKRSGRKFSSDRWSEFRDPNEDCRTNNLASTLPAKTQKKLGAVHGYKQRECQFDLCEAQNFLEKSYEEILSRLGTGEAVIYQSD